MSKSTVVRGCGTYRSLNRAELGPTSTFLVSGGSKALILFFFSRCARINRYRAGPLNYG